VAGKIKSERTRTKVRRIIGLHSEFEKGLLWNPYHRNRTLTAAAIRSYEKLHSNSVMFVHDKKKYVVRQKTKYVEKKGHYSLNITVDGVKKDIRALKSII